MLYQRRHRCRRLRLLCGRRLCLLRLLSHSFLCCALWLYAHRSVWHRTDRTGRSVRRRLLHLQWRLRRCGWRGGASGRRGSLWGDGLKAVRGSGNLRRVPATLAMDVLDRGDSLDSHRFAPGCRLPRVSPCKHHVHHTAGDNGSVARPRAFAAFSAQSRRVCGVLHPVQAAEAHRMHHQAPIRASSDLTRFPQLRSLETVTRAYRLYTTGGSKRALRGRRAMRMRRVRQPKHIITAACTSCLPTRETACTHRRHAGNSCTPPQPCTAHAPGRRHRQAVACLHVHDDAHTRGARRSCADSKHLAGEARRGRRPRGHWRAHHLDTRRRISASASVLACTHLEE